MPSKKNEPQTHFFDKLSREIQVGEGLSEPELWFERLWFVRRIEDSFDEQSDNCIRTLRFRPGLNILWAEPEEFETSAESLYVDGYAGHSTGKTLFCRVVRYLLGEGNFGTKSLESDLQSTFLELWAVASIRLSGKSWLVGRKLSGDGADFSIPDSDFSGCGNLNGKNPPYRAFTDALEVHLGASLRSQFPTESWRHLLPWIARDQEARFASMIAWRDSSSEADNPRANAEIRHLILRAVLGFLDSTEVTIRENITTETATKEREENHLPVKEAVASTELRKLNTNLRAVRDFPGDLKNFDEIREKITVNIEGRKTASEFYKSQPESAAVTTARGGLEKALSEQITESARMLALETEIPELEAEVQDDVLWTERAEAEGMQDSARIDRLFCPNSYFDAVNKHKCIQQPGEHFQESMNYLEALRRQADQKRSKLTKRKKEQQRLEQRQDFHKKEVPRLRKVLSDAQSSQNQELQVIEKELALLNEAMRNLDDAEAASEAAKEVQSKIAAAKKNIDELTNQLKFRKEIAKTELGGFSSVFSDIVEAVIGSSVSGKVSLIDAGLKLHIEKSSELGGAALESVKTIAFDLAAVVHSMEGNGHHPRFLIHDGPREADMARVIYERFFHYVSRMEKASRSEAALFQYIITTTTPPPERMREGSEFLLCDKLSGKTKAGRLLREEF